MAAPTLFTSDDYDSLVLRWLVHEKEAPVEIVRGVDQHETPAPPYFIERDLHLFDHWVIVQYLQERYPGEVLMPVDPMTRAQIRQICVLLREWEAETEKELFGLLGGYPYLLGHNFTLADVYAGARVDMMDIKTERVQNYADRLLLRKALRDAK